MLKEKCVIKRNKNGIRNLSNSGYVRNVAHVLKQAFNLIMSFFFFFDLENTSQLTKWERIIIFTLHDYPWSKKSYYIFNFYFLSVETILSIFSMKFQLEPFLLLFFLSYWFSCLNTRRFILDILFYLFFFLFQGEQFHFLYI